MNKNKMIENRLKKSMDALTPSFDESLNEKPVRAAEGDEWFLEGTKTYAAHKKSLLRPVLAAVFALVLMVGGFQYYSLYMKTYATVYLDLNPSLTVEINSKEKVKDVRADNSDAQIILDGLDLKNINVQTAMDAILGSMVRHGYIDEAHNILLLSLECGNGTYGDALREKLSREVNEYLSAYVTKSYVLQQEISVSTETGGMAEEYGVTPGKMSLIMKAMEADPSLSMEQLAAMPVNELVVTLHDSGFDLRPYSDEVEDLLEAHGFDDDPYEQYYEDEEPDDHDDMYDDFDDDMDDIDDIDDSDDDDADDINDIDDDDDADDIDDDD